MWPSCLGKASKVQGKANIAQTAMAYCNTSAIAILQLIQSIIIRTRNFYKNARDCPTEIRGLLDELMSFETVLENFQSMVEKANGVHVSKLFLIVQKGGSGRI